MPLGLDGISAQFAADGTHSNQAFTRKLANAKCSVFERAAMCGVRAYPCTAALIAEVINQRLNDYVPLRQHAITADANRCGKILQLSVLVDE